MSTSIPLQQKNFLSIILQQIPKALLAAILTIILVFPVYGIKIDRIGTEVSVRYEYVATGVAASIVFFVVMLLPVWRWLNERTAEYRRPSLKMNPREQTAFYGFLIAIAILFPFMADKSWVAVGILVMVYIMLGLGLNIVVGHAGLLDLGFVGFYAVGGYTYGLLFMHFEWSFWEALPLAGLLAGLCGFLLGFPVLRLRGDYLAIVTLGFGEIIRLLIINLSDITNGAQPIPNIPKPTFFGLEFARRPSTDAPTFHQWMGWDYSSGDVDIYIYMIALAFVLLIVFISGRLIRMPIGRAWEALREDEIACRSLGLNPSAIKLTAFTMGAMFAGFGGAFFAAHYSTIEANQFNFFESALILAIVVLGGMGSKAGVILAAILLVSVPEVLRDLQDYRQLMFGLILVLIMAVRPQGLLAVERRHVELPEK